MPLAPLAVWMYRDADVDSIEQAIAKLVDEFNLDRDNLLEQAFTKEVPEDYKAALGTEPLDDAEIAALLGVGAPPPAPTVTRAEFEEKLIAKLKARKLRVDERLIRGIVEAWLARDIVVLVGSPGTGKTRLAFALADALEELLGKQHVSRLVVPITRDHDLASFIGYANLNAELVPAPFTAKVLLRPEDRLKTVVVVLDEWNVARVDDYLSPVLSSLESGGPITLPGATGGEQQPERQLPIDALFIATCNSYLEEPESRLVLSRPVKRRSTIFVMPNLLYEDAKDGKTVAALTAHTKMLLEQEFDAVTARRDGNESPLLDHFRHERLDVVKTYDNFPANVRVLLEKVVAKIFDTPEGQRFFTIGVLKDVVVTLAYAQANAVERALVQQLVGKIFQIWPGTTAQIEKIADLFDGVADKDLVAECVRQIKAASRTADGEAVPLV